MNTAVEEDFSNFSSAATIPAGWTAVSSGGVNSYQGDWGTGNAGGLRGNDDVLGFQHNSSSGIFTITATFTNNTGSTIDQLNISYLGKVERTSEARHPAWTVTVDGNLTPDLGYSTSSGVDQPVSTTITGLDVLNNDTFTITWTSDRGTNSTGSSRQIGIADFSLTAVPEPSTYAALVGLLALGVVMYRRRRR